MLGVWLVTDSSKALSGVQGPAGKTDETPGRTRGSYTGGVAFAMGPLASWLSFALSGCRTFAVDPCNASRTLLFDLATRDWSPALLAAFGIPHEALPRSLPNRSQWATLEVDGRSIPLTIVTGDQSAVPFAFESDAQGTAYLTLGTGAFLQQPVSERPSTATGLLASVLSADGTGVRYASEATINGAGAALGWQIGRASCRERVYVLV